MSKLEVSKYLSYILRHEPESIGLSVDEQGWLNIGDLIVSANQNGQSLTREVIEQVVDASDKKRFTISENGLYIRAAQGHSNPNVKMDFKVKQPPIILYHGTASRFLEGILKEGLKPMSRQYVHLSGDIETALDVGKRYGKPAILRVDTVSMLATGYEFSQAENGVWLVKEVPAEHLQAIDKS